MGFFKTVIAVDGVEYTYCRNTEFENALPFIILNPINLQFSTVDHTLILGLSTEFRSEKIPHNSFGKVLLFCRKCLFRGIPRFTEESIAKLGMELNYMKN